MADLDDFLAARPPFAWGQGDCCLVLADWCIENGHPDPAAHLRGTYDDEASCKRVMASHGGVLGVVSAVAAAAGLPEAAAVSHGVVGVIGSAAQADRQWAGIFDGRRWQVRTLDGFVGLIGRPLKMWRVMHG